MLVQCRRGLAAACVLASVGALAAVSSAPGGSVPTPSGLVHVTATDPLPAGHGSGESGSLARDVIARADRSAFRAALATPQPTDARGLLEPRQPTTKPPTTLQQAVADLQHQREQTAAAAMRAERQAAEAAAAQAAQQQIAQLHRWVRPNGGSLSSPFGIRWGRPHEGIDLAGGYGSPILAATAGRVIYAGPESGYGRIVKILDWDGTSTWYGHMSKFLVNAGDSVVPGQPIALVGAAGDATGPHLHFEVHVGGVVVDPIPFLAARGVRI